MMNRKTLLLAILDGWGIGRPSPTNAITVARTPNMDRWLAECPWTTLTAHNGQVGLPEGQMGNSEVGHLNIGAGRIVYQDFTRINRAIESDEFFTNPALAAMMDQVKEAGSSLHLLGLLSDGGVHSHIAHLQALLEMAGKKGLERVFVHCFMDGRDTPPKSGAGYMAELVAAMQRIGCGRVATISGRFWAMDRDTRWDRVEKAWQAMTRGQGMTAGDPVRAVSAAYSRAETDEFITPTGLVDGNGPVGTIKDRDGVIFFNFRADRARELCRAFTAKDFAGFDVTDRPRASATGDHDRIRERFRPAGGLPSPVHEPYPGRGDQQPRPAPAAHSRDRKVCPRDLLFQWRPRRPLSRGGPDPG